MTVWRANLLGSSGKGMEYFMRHLLGVDDAVRAEESPARLRPAEVRWYETAPRAKLDLVTTIDFRMTSTCTYSDIVLPAATWYEKHDISTTDMHGLLWVVGTQSLSVTASTLVPAGPSQSRLLAPVAVGLWSVGLVLYLLLVSLILLRWLTVPMTPETLGPPYWILMGATAITVLAGARILGLPAALPVTRATAGFVEGFSFVLWAFGTWWIPLLIVLGLWRHVRRHWPLTCEPTLWSVVFPLGMYSVATLSFGKTARLAFMEPLARFMLWVAVAAWVLVAAAFVARLARHPAQPASGAPTASATTTTTP